METVDGVVLVEPLVLILEPPGIGETLAKTAPLVAKTAPLVACQSLPVHVPQQTQRIYVGAESCKGIVETGEKVGVLEAFALTASHLLALQRLSLQLLYSIQYFLDATEGYHEDVETLDGVVLVKP